MTEDLNRRGRARMWRAVSRLPLGPREVFILHAVDELDYPAVAERLGNGVADVERELAEAIVRISRYLASDEE